MILTSYSTSKITPRGDRPKQSLRLISDQTSYTSQRQTKVCPNFAVFILETRKVASLFGAPHTKPFLREITEIARVNISKN